MKRILLIVITLLGIYFPTLLFGQEYPSGVEKSEHEAEKEKKSINMNIDATMLYGQYNTINSDFSVTQDFKKFSYQLDSDFKRSNDYGFSNTSFFENHIGFTGMADMAESWKFTPIIEVSNDSRGMYHNPDFSREEKDYVVVQFDNEYIPTPSRLNFSVGGSYFDHRFIPAGSSDEVVKKSFYKGNGQFSWEYSWTTSIRMKLLSKVAHYDYSTSSNNDTFVTTELLGSFKLTEYIMVNLGPVYSWNRDDTHFVAGKASVSTVNLKYYSIELKYQYDLKPFEPESLYNNEKFVMPYFSLPPARIHKADAIIGLDLQNQSSSTLFLKSFIVKGNCSYERNSDYYNFYTVSQNVLYPTFLALTSIKAKGEISFDIQIVESNFKISGAYEYNYYYSRRHVTYKPEYIASILLKFKIDKFGFEWSNSLFGSVYINPDSDDKLDRALIASATISYKILESFYLYGKVDNMYNSKYYYRNEFPEPGILFIGGIRIQI